MTALQIPLDLRNRLLAEAEELIRGLPERDPAIGDALFVHYAPEFCTRHEIGRYGRMTIKDGETRFHAAPLAIDRTSKYEFVSCDVMDYVKAWDGGQRYHNPVEKLLKGAPIPKLKDEFFEPVVNYQMYEESLFTTLLEWGPFTLVNPSFKTMATLVRLLKKKSVDESFVMLTTTLDHDWVAEVRDFCKNSNPEGRPYLKILRPYEVKGTAYLGTNSPAWFPATDWVRLILSPGIDPSGMFRNYSVSYKPEGVYARYEKKRGYEVSSYLSRDTGNQVWNPETVDATLNIPKSPGLYFLETTMNLIAKPKDNRKLYHSPWMLNMQGTWTFLTFEHPEMRVKGNVVYDVRDPQLNHLTYLSRRMQVNLPEGYVWVPLGQQGTHWVTYSSLKPHRDYNVSHRVQGDKNVYLLGDVQVDEIRIVTAPMGSYFVPKQYAKGFIHELLSDDLNLCTTSEIPPVSYRQAYMTTRGRVIADYRVAQDGISFLPTVNGREMLPFLPRGDLKNIPVYQTDHGGYVSFGALPDGMSFVCQNAKELSALAPTLSLFDTRWQTGRSLISGARDPDFGGQYATDEVMSVLTGLLDFEVKSEQDYGLTAMQISRQTGIGHHVMHYLLRKSNRFYLWRPGNSITAQFVLGKNVILKFRGDRSQEHGRVDGRSWREVLSWIEDGERRFFSLYPIPQSFIYFLRLNLIMVQRGIENGSYAIKLKTG